MLLKKVMHSGKSRKLNRCCQEHDKRKYRNKNLNLYILKFFIGAGTENHSISLLLNFHTLASFIFKEILMIKTFNDKLEAAL